MGIKFKIIGFLLIISTLFLLYLSFAIIFLRLSIDFGNFNISPIIVKIINFIIIAAFLSFVAYVGYIMAFHAKD